MKNELKSGVLSADKSADCRPNVGGVNVIAVLKPRREKTGFLHMRKKGADQLRGIAAKLISAFVFAT